MGLEATPSVPCGRLSEFIAERIGLHFPPERWTDLQRGLAGAAADFGFGQAAACADWLLSATLTKAQLRVLASHFTIGETYFFREKSTFDVLAESVLPELIRVRRSCGQRLRIWSAACCTGEEPYSLAILLRQLIPDLPDWRVTILATDINERFLQKAAAGVYGEWSFRESPALFKERYFRPAGDGRYAILPEIKRLVSFAPLNLVEDGFPSLVTDTNAMDVIFCRNVLMYFTGAQTQKVLRKFHHSLVKDGWLVLSPTEGSQAMLPHFAAVSFPGVFLYQKSEAKVSTGRSGTGSPCGETKPFSAPAPDAAASYTARVPTGLPLESSLPPPTEESPRVELLPSARVAARSLCEQGRDAEAADALLNSFGAQDGQDGPVFAQLARALANQGKLADALAWCDRWVAVNKLDASAHYLRAVILQELGDNDQARRSLQRACYLKPNFVVAHFALGNLARRQGKSTEADRHFSNASSLLRAHEAGDLLPESDGLTASRLTEIIASIVALDNTS